MPTQFQLLGTVPKSLGKHVYLLTAFTAFLFFSTHWIYWPEELIGEVTIFTGSPPVLIKAGATARLLDLAVAENDKVNEGHYLGLLDDNVTLADYQAFKAWLSVYVKNGFTKKPVFPETWWNLGSLSPAFTAFADQLLRWERHLTVDHPDKEVAHLAALLEQEKSLLEAEGQNRYWADSSFRAANHTYQMYQQLFEERAISQAEILRYRQEWISQWQKQSNQKSLMGQLQQKVLQNSHEIEKRWADYLKAEKQLLHGLQTALFQLTTATQNWEQQFVLVSPVSGTVTLTKKWMGQEWVQAGDEILAILPQNPAISVKCEIAPTKAGKLAKGQSVTIRLANYPWREFGILKAEVETVSPLLRDENYQVWLNCPESVTDRDFVLPLGQELKGEASIIVKPARLTDWLFERLFYTHTQSN